MVSLFGSLRPKRTNPPWKTRNFALQTNTAKKAETSKRTEVSTMDISYSNITKPLIISALATLTACGSDSDENTTTQGQKIPPYIPFVATISAGDNQVFVTDGTSEGTIAVADFHSSNNSEVIYQSIPFNNEWLMSVNTTDNGITLAKTDGTIEGTNLISSSTLDGLFPQHLTVFKNQVFFKGSNDEGDSELWITDGTAEGTKLFVNLDSGYFSAESPISGSPANLVVSGDQLFFSAYTSNTGREPWVSDGTVEGTRMIKDLTEDAMSSETYGYFPYNERVFFISGNRLWVSDGTSEGTFHFEKEGLNGPRAFIQLGDKLVIKAAGTNNYSSRGLWITDGTLDNTQRIELPHEDNAINDWAVLNNTLYYTVDGELYSYTEANGALAISAEVNSIAYLEVHNNQLFFRANSLGGIELYTLIDGAISNVKDITDDVSSSNPYDLTSINGELIFVANDGETGYELWKSNGTAEGTIQIKDIQEGSGSSNPSWCSLTNNCLRYE